MRISSTACYGLQLLLCLAENKHLPHPLSAAELAERTGIPDKFSRKILHSLQDARIVNSVRGIAGGYSLAADPADISLTCIIRAVEGGIVPPPVQDTTSPANVTVNAVWAQAAQALEDALGRYSLQNILDSMSIDSISQNHPNATPKGERRREAAQSKDSGAHHEETRSIGRRRSQKSRSAATDATEP